MYSKSYDQLVNHTGSLVLEMHLENVKQGRKPLLAENCGILLNRTPVQRFSGKIGKSIWSTVQSNRRYIYEELEKRIRDISLEDESRLIINHSKSGGPLDQFLDGPFRSGLVTGIIVTAYLCCLHKQSSKGFPYQKASQQIAMNDLDSIKNIGDKIANNYDHTLAHRGSNETQIYTLEGVRHGWMRAIRDEFPVSGGCPAAKGRYNPLPLLSEIVEKAYDVGIRPNLEKIKDECPHEAHLHCGEVLPLRGYAQMTTSDL